jgi:hypothetical protein
VTVVKLEESMKARSITVMSEIESLSFCGTRVAVTTTSWSTSCPKVNDEDETKNAAAITQCEKVFFIRKPTEFALTAFPDSAWTN